MSQSDAVRRFVIPDGILPTSRDPIAIDQFNNYFPGQMLYTQPLIAATDGVLTSDLLQSFEYRKSTNQILLTMKTHGRPAFSDGSEITAEDVAFSIARLAFSRPKFPVLRFIEGLDSWRAQPRALGQFPSGISFEGDQITIDLTKPQLNPLFRLTLNVVSVIPRRCVDIETNELTCSDTPTSGFYKEKNRNESTVSYERRIGVPSTLPRRIDIAYPKVGRNILGFLAQMDNLSVAWLYDLDFSPEQYKYIETNFQVFRLAEAWFTGFVLNPHVKPFDDLIFRRWFVQELQTRIQANHLGPTVYSRSLFPEIVPGYLKESDFEVFHFTNAQVADFRNRLKNFEFFWGIRKTEPPPILMKSLQDLATTYNFELMAPTVAKSSHSGFESYENSQTVLQTSNSGFWPLDPAGDVQMLFTPQLHQDYKDLWSDQKLNGMIAELAEAVDLKVIESAMRKINLYLYDQAVFSIFSHYGYFYARKAQSSAFVESGTVSLTMPYPWQVFGEAKR